MMGTQDFENSTIIAKELIGKLTFAKEEVLSDKKDILQRTIDLKIAERLGNNHKGKAKIWFKTEKTSYKVETTIWATTEKYIALKGGVLIPIWCIGKVMIY